MDQKAFYKLGYGLYILTAENAEGFNGCVVNTVVQVTSSPARITVAVNKQNLTHDLIRNTGVFNVSVLSEKAEFSVFERFGFQSGKTADKFSGYDSVKKSENGILYITEGTNAFLSAKVISETDLGTHTLFLADVTDGEVLDTAESATYSFYQSNIKPKPQPVAKKGWRCKICGYLYEGDELPEDFICPICKHGAADFEKIDNAV